MAAFATAAPAVAPKLHDEALVRSVNRGVFAGTARHRRANLICCNNEPDGKERENLNQGSHNDSPLRASVGILARLRALFLAPFSGASSAKKSLKAYGIAAVLAYGIFDGFTYSMSFLIALKGFTARTGKALTRETFPQVFALCWGINNFSRPFRIAGALLLAPLIDTYVVKPVTAIFRKKKKSGGLDEDGI